jgi:hypothetical protein
MGRRPGSTNSPEHNDHISEAISKRYQDDPEYAELLSQSARRRWVREYWKECDAVYAELEAGRLQRQLIIGLRAMKRTLEDGQQLDDTQKTLLRGLRVLNRSVQKSERGHFIHKPEKESGMSVHDAASTPYVSETQTRHPPMTGRHSHDHAAFGHPDHDDGVHSHMHEHQGDADHDPGSNEVHGHPHPGGERPGRVPQGGQAVSGMYGAELSDNPAGRSGMGTAARNALRRERQRRLDGRG